MRKRGIEMEGEFKVYIDHTPNIYEEDLVDFISERVNIKKEHCCAALHYFMEFYRACSSQFLEDISSTSCFSYRVIYGDIIEAIKAKELPEKFRII